MQLAETLLEALHRAGKIFGTSVSPLRNVSNLSDLATKLKDAAGPAVEPCQILKDRLVAADEGDEDDEDDD